MKFVKPYFVRTAAVVLVLAGLFFGLSWRGEAYVYNTDYLTQTSQNNSEDTICLFSESEVAKTVFDYVEFSREGRFSELQKITIDVEKVRQQYGKNKNDRLLKEVGNINNSSPESPQELPLDTSKMDEFNRKILVSKDPLYIKDNQLEIDGFSVKMLDENRCLVIVALGNAKKSIVYTQDYYMFKDENIGWKIYKVLFPSGARDLN